jgi:hypothetical protein
MTKRIQKGTLEKSIKPRGLKNQDEAENKSHRSRYDASFLSSDVHQVELQAAQREHILFQIGQVQGNHYLQRIIQREPSESGEFEFTKLVRGPNSTVLEVEGNAPGLLAGRVDLFNYEGGGCNPANKIGEVPFNAASPVLVVKGKFKGKISIFSSATPGVGKKALGIIKNMKGESVGTCCGTVGVE